jgi:D-alanyl-lipoteichoic acid acyltransferase DltB (MBOAT superfamily)
MLFIEPVFFVFFAVVAASYWFLSSNAARKWLLLGASYIFYGAWDWRFLGLILFCTVLSHATALLTDRRVGGDRLRPWICAVAVTANLSVLFFFKYFGFFTGAFADFAGMFGAQVNPVTLNVLLPVGISFYTFQAMSYYLDVHRGTLRAEPSFRDVALYIAFFPQLVAGPIVRAADFLPQLHRRRFLADVPFRASLLLFLVGFFKKACVSDNIAPLVDQVFADPASHDSISVVAATLFYAVQIYCDFSGYSDMAIAAAGLLGYHLIPNFDAPYFAANITEFWRRWHISLSSWLRDYLYIPLGGNRHGPWKRHRNLMLTMLLGGLWHGASYNFVIWGAMHGLALIVHHGWQGLRAGTSRAPRLPTALGTLVTFYWVCIAWIFFRAATLEQALAMTATFVTLESPGSVHLDVGPWWGILAVLALAQWLDRKIGLATLISRASSPVFYAGAGGAAALLIAFVPTGYRPFIYFQF